MNTTPTMQEIGPVHLARILAEQGRLATPAARFAERHEAEPALAGVYRDLIPLEAPRPGEQYAFEVNLDACSGCKACVAGCHALNGLDEDETWRDVGLILGGAEGAAYQQTVTAACHHCADPGCLNGCPVLAYEKDPVTGIVRHLDDQCIGCQYCVLTCPYDVPKYNERLGIVRKCDLCHGRLAAGEAPACVQACPTHAIRVVKVALDPDGSADTSRFLPAAPSPRHTGPTTRYVSRLPVPPDARPADADARVAQHAHAPLAVMLALTQLSVGVLAAGALRPALALAVAGTAASVFHLGRPERAWRAFLGLKRSWLSREIVAFGAYVPVLALAAWTRSPLFATASLALGAVGVFCSAMIYAVTPRRYWATRWTLSRFVGTVAAGLLAVFAVKHGSAGPAATALVALSLLRLALERTQAAGVPSSRRLLSGPLRKALKARHACSLAAPFAFALGAAWAGVPLLIASEVAERLLFFRAVDPSKMPGGPAN